MALESWKQNALNAAIEAAKKVQEEHPTYPRALAPVSVAQFILESDWGTKSMAEANNYFGIKARDDEPYITRITREFIGGRWTTVHARFRRFSSMAECFEAHAQLICERRYKTTSTTHQAGDLIYAEALKHPDDPKAFAQALQGVYATDPEYGTKLIDLMYARDLITPEGASNV